jgi:hypothetical protein
MNIKMTIPLCVAAVAMRAGAVMVVGDANTTTVVTPSNTIITATQNATLTVTEPGEIEILLVGGGGSAQIAWSTPRIRRAWHRDHPLQEAA